MLDNQQAKKLLPLVNNPPVWEALLEFLLHLKTLELQALVGATSEQEIFRSQGKVTLLVRLEQLKDSVNATKNNTD
jgi:hypothetical protein